MRLTEVVVISVTLFNAVSSFQQVRSPKSELKTGLETPKAEIQGVDTARAKLGQLFLWVRVTNDSDQRIVTNGGVVVKVTGMDGTLAVEGPLACASHFFSPCYHNTKSALYLRGSTVFTPHETYPFLYGLDRDYKLDRGVKYEATAYYCLDAEEVHCREGNTVVISF